MKTFKLILIVVAAFIALYVLGILVATIGNGFNAYETYPRMVAELGFIFRLLILLVLSMIVWLRAENKMALFIGLAFIELLIILSSAVGYMFGGSEFLLGVPFGLVLQDVLAQIGVGALVKACLKDK